MAVLLSPSPLYRNWAMSSQVFLSRSFSSRNWIPWSGQESDGSQEPGSQAQDTPPEEGGLEGPCGSTRAPDPA